LTFIEAAKIAGMRPDVARRWLDRPEVRRLLLAERRVFRDALCAGNEGALARVRDKSENGMAVIGAVRALENIADEAEIRSPLQQTPGLVIQIVNGPGSLPQSAGITIEAEREPAAAQPAASVTIPAPFAVPEPELVEPASTDPIFRHPLRPNGSP
jgi:hypothetical protein